MCYSAAKVRAKKLGMSTSTLAFVMLCAGTLHAQQSKPLLLNNAITQSARSIENRLNARTRVAILDFSSDSENLSDYIIDKLSGELVNNDKVTVIERQRPDLIRKEIAIQLSGDVDDGYMARIGKQWGAQVIVYGSLRTIGATLSFMIKSVDVETARIEAQVFYDIERNDPILAGILDNGTSARIEPTILYEEEPPLISDAPSGLPRERDTFPWSASSKTTPGEGWSTTPPKKAPTKKTIDIGDFEVGNWLSFYNPTGANNGDLRLGIYTYVSFTRSFTDSFGLSVLLQHYSGINTGETAEYYKDRGISPIRDFLYLRVTPSFSLPFGPGYLSLSLQLMPVFYLTNNYDHFYEYGGRDIGPTFIFNPVIKYRLGSDIGYWWFTLGTEDMGIAEGADYDKDTGEYKYGLWINDLYFSAELGLSMGLNLWSTAYFFINTNDYQIDSYFRKLRVGMEYDLNSFPLSLGLNVDFPVGAEINKTTMEYQGISLLPYARARFGGLTIRANFYTYHVGANPDYREVVITPEIGIFYSFHL